MSAILVVDDDADMCHNMADLFGDAGYAIDTAVSGDNALLKARQQSYDLALLDMRMPGMDGLTLCRHLKEMQPAMAAMIVTAYADDLHDQAHEAGASHVFSKPLDFRKLLATVKDVLINEN